MLEPANRNDWPMLLRRYRTAESARLVWRDVLGLDDVDATLAGSTRLAEICLQTALAGIGDRIRAALRHGAVAGRQRRSAWWCSAWASSAAAS